MNQSEQWIKFATLALRVAEGVLPAYAHKYSPQRYTLPQLAACVMLKEYCRLDWRASKPGSNSRRPCANAWDCGRCRIIRRCGILPNGGWSNVIYG